jgi:hypothetical protein
MENLFMNLEAFNAHFPNRLVVSPTINAKTWCLEQDFKYITTAKLESKDIIVPKGFLTDFASVPIPIRSIIPKWGKYGRAAVIHDWLYYEGNKGGTKEFADQVLLEAMEISGVNSFVRTIIFKAVDWFGMFAWLSNEVKRKLGKEKIDTTGVKTFTYEYSPAWTRDLKEQIPDMWKEWKDKRKPDDTHKPK